MFSKVNSLADRVLARIVPTIEAAAGCAPSSYYQYKCVDHVKYRRYCVNTESCTTTCKPWEPVARC